MVYQGYSGGIVPPILNAGIVLFPPLLMMEDFVLGPVKGFEVILTGSVTIRWESLPGVSMYTLLKSVNGGVSFTVLTTVQGTFTDPAWDPSVGRYVVNDAIGDMGHVYMLQITDGLRNGVPTIATPKMEFALTTVYGLIVSPTGEELDQIQRRVDIHSVGDHTSNELLIAGVHPDITRYQVTRFADPETGLWQVHLLQGQLVRVRIPATDVDKVIRVPRDNTRAWAIEQLLDESPLDPSV